METFTPISRSDIMSWKKIVKAKGKSFGGGGEYEEEIAQEIAKDLNFGEGEFWLYMDDFNIDIEVSNVGTGDDSTYPTEEFAIRVKPSGTIKVMDENVGTYKPNNIVKSFKQKDIIIRLDGTKPKPMEEKSGAFIFKVSYEVDEYSNGKLYVSVEI